MTQCRRALRKMMMTLKGISRSLKNCLTIIPSLSLPANESYHFDIPSPYRPHTKPPDGNTETLNIKMMGDVSDQKVPIPNLTITRILNQEKSPDLLSHLGFEAFQPSAECLMIINGKNTPVLDVPLFHFYPLDQFKYGGIRYAMCMETRFFVLFCCD
uniref:Uncharacterized protein n=1 Tax=Tanacetum cinerariifolium TaxID=118510 RepID=A0A6L2NZI3_TANCI|nr:hypothetical protein [Tanacetum cinerariifolium]